MRHIVKRGICCDVHSHRDLEIVYHPTGSGYTRLPKRELVVPFQEQSVVIYGPEEAHDQVMESAGEDLCVQISLPLKRGLFPNACLYLPRLETPSLIEDLRMLSHGYTRLSPMEQTIFDFRATATVLALIDLYCSVSQREAAPLSERYVLKAEQHIRDHLLEIASVSQIAEHVGISSHHLRHLFKALRGKSLVRHINEMRIDRAKSLLSHSRLPMKQIASLCGFKDQYYFSTVFTAMTRCAPGHYRRQNG